MTEHVAEYASSKELLSRLSMLTFSLAWEDSSVTVPSAGTGNMIWALLVVKKDGSSENGVPGVRRPARHPLNCCQAFNLAIFFGMASQYVAPDLVSLTRKANQLVLRQMVASMCPSAKGASSSG